MQAACVGPSFGLANLKVIELDQPRLRPTDVLLRLRAASLNYRDLLVARGEYNPSYPLPLILGSDAVGEVVELGSEVEAGSLPLGSRVCPLFAQGWLQGPPSRSTVRHTLGGPLPGVFARYAAVAADSVVRVPDALSDLEAACLPCAGLTAWSALCTLGSLRKGESVLILGTGGVSVLGAQIALALGARVIATTRNEAKRERLLALGVEAVVVAQGAGWGEAVRRTIGGEGVDHVLEVGGAGTLIESLRAVRPGGTVSLIGTLAGGQSTPSLLPAVMRNVRLQGVFVGHRDSFRALLLAAESWRLHPVVDSSFELGHVNAAMERLACGDQFGKVCLTL
ncbi:MAG TPA: NAD(P)-dependent alcohol dehydrogenase [Polyangiaceae bacterium]|nr:NAD(P)-dependent alcohol dehydrogenase [Polyangiaceae bacterium]